MTDVEWPQELPRVPLQNGFTVKPVSNVHFNQTEKGPGKTRRKQTALIKEVTLAIDFKDLPTLYRFWDFFEDETFSGALRFKWPELNKFINNRNHEYQLDPEDPFTQSANEADFTGQLNLRAWPVKDVD